MGEWVGVDELDCAQFPRSDIQTRLGDEWFEEYRLIDARFE